MYDKLKEIIKYKFKFQLGPICRFRKEYQPKEK